MKVSIITATYNSSKTILDTLYSVQSQSYKNIEHIIVDGKSEDDTLNIINLNSRSVAKIISEPDLGIYDALNKGINNATGDIIGFLHSDDVFSYPDAIADLVNAIENNNSDAVYADIVYVSKDKEYNVIRYWKSGEFKRNRIKYGWMPPHPTFFMKRELYIQHGLFDLNFKISADYDSILRYIWVNNVVLSYLPKVVTRMRIGGESNKTVRNIINKTKEDILVLKKNNIPWVKAIFFKNISKISQFIKKK